MCSLSTGSGAVAITSSGAVVPPASTKLQPTPPPPCLSPTSPETITCSSIHPTPIHSTALLINPVDHNEPKWATVLACFEMFATTPLQIQQFKGRCAPWFVATELFCSQKTTVICCREGTVLRVGWAGSVGALVGMGLWTRRAFFHVVPFVFCCRYLLRSKKSKRSGATCFAFSSSSNA